MKAAQIFAADLEAAGGEFDAEVARRIKGQIAVAQLSGRSRIDFGLAMGEIGQAQDDAASTAELDMSIEQLIGQVIDLR